MPIRINYAAKPWNKDDKKAFLSDHRTVYGRNELHAWAYGIGDAGCSEDGWHQQKRGFKGAHRVSHFNMSKKFDYKQDMFKLSEELFEIHEWLSDNITSPWLMQDSLSEGRASCFIHIERMDERELFNQYQKDLHHNEFDRLFSAAEFSPKAIKEETIDLAIMKGLIASYSMQEDYQTWVQCSYGFDEGRKKIDGKIYHTLIPEREDLLESFQRELVDTGIYTPGENGLYLCEHYKAERKYTAIKNWTDNALGIENLPKVPAGLHGQRLKEGMPFASLIAFNHQGTEDAFKAKWGSHFHYNDEYNYYFCNKEEFPKTVEREVPSAFVDYLNGRGPDPSLKLQS